MTLPIFPPTDPRALPPVVPGDEGFYLAADRDGINDAAWYAIALQRSLEDAEDLLEPALPPQARPYVEVFERYLLDRAEHYMATWGVTPSNRDITPR